MAFLFCACAAKGKGAVRRCCRRCCWVMGEGPNHRWGVNPKIMEPWCLYGGLKRGYAKMERF